MRQSHVFCNVEVSAEELSHICPTGVIRCVINLGNPVLASRSGSGLLCGVTVDLAKALAIAIGRPYELIPVRSAGEAVALVGAGDVDVGFFAVDPVRGRDIAYSAPYLSIETNYLVRTDSPITKNQEVDLPGNTVAVGKGSAYDLYLSRELRHADLVRIDTSSAVVDEVLARGLTVAAGVRRQLDMDVLRFPGLVRILPTPFATVHQAMGVSRTRGTGAAAVLERFMSASLESGIVDFSLAAHGVR